MTDATEPSGTAPSEPSADSPGDDSPGDDRVEGRAELLPEERAAGSAAPLEQAEAILEESDERTEHPERTRRQSQQTPDPQ